MRRISRMLALLLFVIAAPATVARSAGPADDLLKLVPPDAGATLLVENFRDRYREIKESPLYEAARRLPLVEGWLRSAQFVQLDRAGQDLEKALGIPGSVFRDEIIGDALILTFQPGPAEAPDQARGLLLARPRDRALLDRLVNEVNAAQVRSRELVSVEARQRDGHRYGVRTFRPGGKPTEYYAFLPEEVFAWTNSEEMLRGVIDRKAGHARGLLDDSSFRKVRQKLPADPLISLFLNPRLLGRAIPATSNPNPGEPDRVAAMLRRYVEAVDHAGFALQVKEGVRLHSSESIAPERLEPWLKAWLAGPPRPAANLLALVPETAMIVVAADVDFRAVGEAIHALLSDEGRENLPNLRQLAQGLLLGLDPVAEVVPRLGPGTLAYLEALPSPARPRFPLVNVITWSDRPDGPELAPAIDNGLRSLLALRALDPKTRPAHLRVEPRTVEGVRVTELTDGTRARLAFRVDRNRLVLSNSAAAVARFEVEPEQGGSRFASLRDRSFPGVETFAIVELPRLAAAIRSNRTPLARRFAARSQRPIEEVDRDLDQVLTMLDLFRVAWFTSVAEPDGSAIDRVIHLIAR